MKFRKFCFKIVQWGHFESIILVLIVFSSIKLAVDTYFIEDPTTDLELLYSEFSAILDYVFNISFIIECVLKIISYGFILDENSYIRGINYIPTPTPTPTLLRLLESNGFLDCYVKYS